MPEQVGNNRIAQLPAPLWVCCSLGLKDVCAALSAVLREAVNIILKPKQRFGGELARDARTACLTRAGLPICKVDAGKPGTSWILLLKFSKEGWTYTLLPFLKASLVMEVAKG